jgi:hypothetical protein
VTREQLAREVLEVDRRQAEYDGLEATLADVADDEARA